MTKLLPLNDLVEQHRAQWEAQERAAFHDRFPNNGEYDMHSKSAMYTAWMARAELHPCHINVHDTKDAIAGEIVYAR